MPRILSQMELLRPIDDLASEEPRMIPVAWETDVAITLARLYTLVEGAWMLAGWAEVGAEALEEQELVAAAQVCRAEVNRIGKLLVDFDGTGLIRIHGQEVTADGDDRSQRHGRADHADERSTHGRGVRQSHPILE